MVNAAGTLLIIDSLSPEQGKESDTVVINGKNFGDRNTFVNSNRYVNFNGFLGTEILQWSDSAIEIKIPQLGAVANEQKETAVDIVSAIPIVRSYAKLPLKLLPIRVAKAPEESGTRAVVSVVIPNGKSNEVYFLYEHVESSAKVNYIWDTAKLIGRTFFDEYIKKPFNTILHPIQALQNKTERITRTINNSIVLPLSENINSVDRGEKKIPPKQQPPPIETKLHLIPGKIIAYVTDQYGKPYGPDSGTIVDALGEKAGRVTIEKGQLESDKVLPIGQYTINKIGSSYGETPVIKTFTLPAEGINLGTVIVNRWGSVKVRVINEVGTTLRDARKLLTRCEITDEFIKAEDDNRYPRNAPGRCAWLANHGVGSDVYSWGVQTDYAILGRYPTGNYTIKIYQYGYDGYEAVVEKSFSVNNRDVDLGTIVLKKQ